MKKRDAFRAWGRILQGRAPFLSIEITKECPLRCPGCYAYGSDHLGGDITLRQVNDFKGQELIDKVLGIVNEENPIHVSIVGGEPLVRFRELETILPTLAERGIYTQLVTSAVRPIPQEWAKIPRRPSRLGHDRLTSTATTSAGAPWSSSAARRKSSTLLPQIEATTVAPASISRGRSSAIHRATPGPWRPTALSIPAVAGWTRGAGLPCHSKAASDFTTTAPSAARSP